MAVASPPGSTEQNLSSPYEAHTGQGRARGAAKQFNPAQSGGLSGLIPTSIGCAIGCYGLEEEDRSVGPVGVALDTTIDRTGRAGVYLLLPVDQ